MLNISLYKVASIYNVSPSPTYKNKISHSDVFSVKANILLRLANACFFFFCKIDEAQGEISKTAGYLYYKIVNVICIFSHI